MRKIRVERGRSLTWLRLGALVAGVVLVGVSIGVGVLSGQEDRAALDRLLVAEDRKQADAIVEYFDRAREILLLSARNPVFADFYREPGDRFTKIGAGSESLAKATDALTYIEALYPDQVEKISFIDSNGAENARVVHGRRSATIDLSTDETASPYFAPTFAIGEAGVYHAPMYRASKTGEMVISNSTVIPGLPEGKQAMIHFEVSLASFAQLRESVGADFLIVDGRTGDVLSDGRPGQGEAVPGEFRKLVEHRETSGLLTVNGYRVAFAHLPSTDTNANDWYVVAAAPSLDDGLAADFGLRTIVLFLAAAALFTFAVASFRGYQRRLELAAVTDPLTGLPNRNMLADRVEQALLARRRTGDDVALLVLDLDRFKEVNDTLGHHCGDELLSAIGPRMRGKLREGDTVARLGGDEFAVLLPTVQGISGAMEVAGRILNRVREPFQVGELALEVEASVGIALAPYHGEDFNQLLQHADAAMYVAKESSLGASLYDVAFDTYNPRRLSMLAELRRAIDNDELELYYQPKALLPTEEPRGVEALVRWNHPTRGLVMPNEFIPFAERTALIQPLTDWVIERAVRDVRHWLDAGREITVAVNVSARSLLDHRLCDTVRSSLERHDVPSRLLMVEITETAIMTDPNKAREVLVALDALGVEVSIDDFGSGYSSLAYLKTLPVHELKIDRSFVMNMCQHKDDAVIVRSVIDLAKNLGLRVIAEGVEDADTRQHLVDAGCHMAQGYLWSKPVPAKALEDWLDTRMLARQS